LKAKLLLTLTLVLFLLVGAFLSLPAAEAAPRLARSVQNVIFALGPQSVTSTGAQTVTPTRSLLLTAPVAVLTITLATGEALPGDQLLVVNTVATTTDVVVTNTTLAATVSLLEHDAIKFTYADGVWVHEYTGDNNP
jgi:hypothetical protein